MSFDYGTRSKRFSDTKASNIYARLLSQLKSLYASFWIDGLTRTVRFKGWHTVIPVFKSEHDDQPVLWVGLGIRKNGKDISHSVPEIAIYRPNENLSKRKYIPLDWDSEHQYWIWDYRKLLAKVWDVYEGTDKQMQWYRKSVKLKGHLTTRIAALLEIDPSKINFPSFPDQEVPLAKISIQLDYDWGKIDMHYDDPMFILQGIYPDSENQKPLQMYRGDLQTVINFISSSWRHYS